jgi:hypothetical protein
MEHTLDGQSYVQVATALRDTTELGRTLTRHIAEQPAAALFFECAPVSRSTRHEPFRYVLPPTDALVGVRPDPSAFAAKLSPPAAAFDNLGGDARLVAPAGAVPRGCAHLADWARTAPTDEIDALWTLVGRELLAWFERTDAPVWLSTSGLGVPWLHVRLDERPKYVTHVPYRRWIR